MSSQEVLPRSSVCGVEVAFAAGLPTNVWLCAAPARPGKTIGSSLSRCVSVQLAWNSRYCACGGLSVNVLTGDAVAVGTGACRAVRPAPVPAAGDGATLDGAADDGAGWEITTGPWFGSHAARSRPAASKNPKRLRTVAVPFGSTVPPTAEPMAAPPRRS